MNKMCLKIKITYVYRKKKKIPVKNSHRNLIYLEEIMKNKWKIKLEIKKI
jgi:hypothetical protein